VLVEAILGAENSGKLLGDLSCAPNPAWEAHGVPWDPLADGRKLAAPSPQQLHPRSRPRFSAIRASFGSLPNSSPNA